MAWAGIAIQAAGGILKTIAQENYYGNQENALEVRETEERIAATEASRKRNDDIERVMGKQIVYAASSGATTGSFAPIEQKDFDEFARDRNAIKMNLQFKEAAIDSEWDILEEKIAWSPFLNLFGAGEGIWNISSFGGSDKNSDDKTSKKGGTKTDAVKSASRVKGTVRVGRYYGISEDHSQSILGDEYGRRI